MKRLAILALLLSASAHGQSVSSGQQTIVCTGGACALDPSYTAGYIQLTANATSVTIPSGNYGAKVYHLTICQGAGGPYTVSGIAANMTGDTSVSPTGCSYYRMVWDVPSGSWITSRIGLPILTTAQVAAAASAAAPVQSVNGRTGAVLPASGDYTASQVGADAIGAATAAQSAAQAYASNASNLTSGTVTASRLPALSTTINNVPCAVGGTCTIPVPTTVTINATSCTLGGSCTVPIGGAGTVTSFGVGTWPAWLTPSVSTATTTPSLAVTASAIPNTALANSSITINGTAVPLGATITTPQGTVTSVTGTAPIVSSGGTAPALSCPTCLTTSTTLWYSGTTGNIGGSLLAVGACASGTATVTGVPVGRPGYVAPSDGSFIGGNYTLTVNVATAGIATVNVCAVIAGVPPAKTYSIRFPAQ